MLAPRLNRVMTLPSTRPPYARAAQTRGVVSSYPRGIVEEATASEPMWAPDPGRISRSNLSSLMDAAGVETYEALHDWSVTHRSEFWAVVMAEIGIQCRVDPGAVMGSSDPEHPQWLAGARLNIVDSCLDGDTGAAAIVSSRAGRLSQMSVGELRSEVARFVSGFEAAGFVPGDRLAIAMPMTVEAVIAYVGIVAAGGVVVSIADSFAPDEIRVRLGLTDPVAVVTQDVSVRSGRTLPMYAKCVEAASTRCIVVDTGAGIDLRPGDRSWSDFLGDGDELHTVAMSPDSHTNVLFSSGTTGEPKAIPWTQVTPIKAAMDGRYHQDIHPGDVVAWPTNLGWMMGPWLIYAALLNDAAIALYDDAPTDRGFVRFVEQARVTMLGLVPSIVSALRASGALQAGDWSTVEVISSTGEASNADDYAWLSHVAGNVPIIEYCGGTEVGGGYITATVVQPSQPSRFTTPALGLQLVLLDEDGREADVGEVFLVGPSMGLSEELVGRDHHQVYYDGTPAHPERLRRHGDRLAREPSGTYRALGRVDDTMNLGGIKVSSAELEETVAPVEGVAEVAAVAVPPPDGGPDRLIIFVVPAASNLDPLALREAMQGEIRAHLNPLFRVHEVVLVDTLPRTASQKVMRRVLRDGYSA